MSKLYVNKELLAPITKETHLVNKGYVDNLLNSRLQQGVKVVLAEDFNADYDASAMTLTQKIPTTLIVDGIQLVENDELLYIGSNDKTRNGRYIVTTVGIAPVESVASLSLGASNTGVITADNVTLDKSVFETKIGTPTSGSYIFSYDGTTDNSWEYDGNAIAIADYGITIATDTSADGDVITIAYTESVQGTASVLTRSELMNKSSQLFSGLLTPIHEGLVYGDSIFQLVTDGNLVLDTTSLVFEKYKGASEGANTFETSFTGNNSDKEFVITHGLSTKKIVVKIYNADEEECIFGVKITSENAITITSDVVLSDTDTFRVVILG